MRRANQAPRGCARRGRAAESGEEKRKLPPCDVLGGARTLRQREPHRHCARRRELGERSRELRGSSAVYREAGLLPSERAEAWPARRRQGPPAVDHVHRRPAVQHNGLVGNRPKTGEVGHRLVAPHACRRPPAHVLTVPISGRCHSGRSQVDTVHGVVPRWPKAVESATSSRPEPLGAPRGGAGADLGDCQEDA